jgi:hypothetical protein
MDRIASQDSRAEARIVFEDWLKMLERTRDAVDFVKRTNDVAVLHVTAGEPDTPNVNNHFARNLAVRYGHGSNPVRCIDITGVERGVVQLNMLLTELKLSDGDE